MQKSCVWLRSWLATRASIVLPPPVWHAGEVDGGAVVAAAETQSVGLTTKASIAVEVANAATDAVPTT